MAIITGVFANLGALCYLVAVSKGPVTLVSTFTALYPALAVLLGVALLNESVTARQGFGILLALVAMMLVAL